MQGREWTRRTEGREATEREQAADQVGLCRLLQGLEAFLSQKEKSTGV